MLSNGQKSQKAAITFNKIVTFEVIIVKYNS